MFLLAGARTSPPLRTTLFGEILPDEIRADGIARFRCFVGYIKKGRYPQFEDNRLVAGGDITSADKPVKGAEAPRNGEAIKDATAPRGVAALVMLAPD